MSLHSRAVLGAIDQAITAAAHFLLGVMVARMGGVAALGRFAFAYTVIVLASMFHSAILGEIYSVDESAKAGRRLFGLGYLVLPTLAMAVALVAISQLLLLLGDEGGDVTSLSFIGALVTSMLFWSAKVHLYCDGEPLKAVLCSCLYAATMLITTFGCYHFLGSGARPLTGIMVGAAVALMVLIPSVRGIALSRRSLEPFVRASARYAKWSVPAAGLIWLANNGYYLLMPVGSSVQQTAGLRAILNLLVPLNTLLVGASAALLPKLAEVAQTKGRGALAAVAHRMAAVVLLVAGLFAIAVSLVSERLLNTVYGTQFGQFAPALQVASLLPALWGVAVVYRTSIRAMGESFDLFKVYFFALFPTGIALMVMLSTGGAARAVFGVVITQVLIVSGFTYRFLVMTRAANEVQLRQG